MKLLIVNLFLSLQRRPEFPLLECKYSCHDSVLVDYLPVNFTERRQLRFNTVKLHSEHISQCSHTVVKYGLRRLVFIVVSNFKYSFNFVIDNDRVVENLFKSFDVCDSLEQSLYGAHLVVRRLLPVRVDHVDKIVFILS